MDLPLLQVQSCQWAFKSEPPKTSKIELFAGFAGTSAKQGLNIYKRGEGLTSASFLHF